MSLGILASHLKLVKYISKGLEKACGIKENKMGVASLSISMYTVADTNDVGVQSSPKFSRSC